MILCGDIGATKSLLALALRDQGRIRLPQVRRYLNAGAADFAALIRQFLDDVGATSAQPARIAAAAFGVAGPVEADHVRMTNLPWEISAPALSAELGGVPVALLNDFEIAAGGLDDVAPEHLVTLQTGDPLPDAPQVVIGAGSGLGVAYRCWNGARHVVVRGEGGHAGFAPSTADDTELLRHLQRALPRVSAEHVVSGPGLLRIHAWLVQRTPGAALVRSAEELWTLAFKQHEPTAVQAFASFARCFGAVAGDHALGVLARGGVFLTGGIAPRIRALLDGVFLDAFRDKGAHAGIAARMPVHLVTEENLPLLGAMRAAENLLAQ